MPRSSCERLPRRFKSIANLSLILVGDETELKGLVAADTGNEPRLRIVHASEVVAMAEPPADALRKKKDSSMRVAIDLVKSGDADACVSAGNTGALMATARFVLKMLPGIDRPAIIAELPAKGGSLHMLDLGANTQGSAEHLFQYAVMGSIVASDIQGIDKPRIALLNIGAEDTKGDDTVREAAAMLHDSTLNYVGFIEGSDLFSGKADVVVTDGFTGNVALKTMEGTVGLCAHYLRRAFTPGLASTAAGCSRASGAKAACGRNGLPQLQRCDSGRTKWYCNQEPWQRGCLRVSACDRHRCR